VRKARVDVRERFGDAVRFGERARVEPPRLRGPERGADGLRVDGPDQGALDETGVGRRRALHIAGIPVEIAAGAR
jgi:hypothetical protein